MAADKPAFRPLTGIHEPSAVLQLPDSRFLVVEDEKEYPFRLFSIHPDGSVESYPLIRDDDDPAGKLADLEGLTSAPDGFIYAITSHSRNSAGEEKPSREKLVRFRCQENRLVDTVVFKGLKPLLMAADPRLAAAAARLDVKAEGGLNIEALEFDPDRQALLIGLRGPLFDGKAVVACLRQPDAIFTQSRPTPDIPELILLDLLGQGIRGLAWVAALGGFLLVSGPVAREHEEFRLWFWQGRPDKAPRRVEIKGLDGLARAEGISPAWLAGQQKIIIVSDDGSRERGQDAQFLLLDLDELIIR